jgi:hypothetical protein
MGIIGRPDEDGKLKPIVRDLKEGQTVYIVPGALVFDDDMTPYLNVRAPVKEHPDRKFCLPIRRTGPGLEDFEIDITKVNFKWQPYQAGELAGHNYLVRLNYNERSKPARIGPLTLQRQMELAIAEENYELAALIRDKINRSGNSNSVPKKINCTIRPASDTQIKSGWQ